MEKCILKIKIINITLYKNLQNIPECKNIDGKEFKDALLNFTFLTFLFFY